MGDYLFQSESRAATVLVAINYYLSSSSSLERVGGERDGKCLPVKAYTAKILPVVYTDSVNPNGCLE